MKKQIDAAVPNASPLSIGSDGTDGCDGRGRGYVTGDTCAALKEYKRSAEALLADNDAYHVLETVGGLIKTGPTGTNVNDLVIGLISV